MSCSWLYGKHNYATVLCSFHHCAGCQKMEHAPPSELSFLYQDTEIMFLQIKISAPYLISALLLWNTFLWPRHLNELSFLHNFESNNRLCPVKRQHFILLFKVSQINKCGSYFDFSCLYMEARRRTWYWAVILTCCFHRLTDCFVFNVLYSDKTAAPVGLHSHTVARCCSAKRSLARLLFYICCFFFPP